MNRIYKMLKKNNKGFTLVELLVVVLIIGILVAIAIPVYNKAQLGAAQKAHDANLRTIDAAIMMYYAENGEYPKEVGGEVTAKTVLVEYIETWPEIPEAVMKHMDEGWGTSGYTYTISDDDVPKAQPVGTWDGAYRGSSDSSSGGGGS